VRDHVLVAALLAPLTACGGSGGGRHADCDYDYAGQGDDSDARDEAAEEARRAAYEGHGAGSDGSSADLDEVDAYDVEDSGDYVCTQDCSGHEARFAWAQERDFTDESVCGGDSQSFIEGCEAFLRDRQEQADRLAQEAGEEAAQDAYDSYESEDKEEERDDGRMVDWRY